MGKSSLMVRAAVRLRDNGAHPAIVDLSQVGSSSGSVTADEWYYTVSDTLMDRLGLVVDLDAWWSQRAKLTAVGRFARLLRDIVLAQAPGPVVVFFDEIDSTLRLRFRHDFFAALRACHSARAIEPAYNRLTFVLLGVASPSDLISDPKNTPFNIGRRIELTDFTSAEAELLADGLAGQPPARQSALQRILHWTDGHPYLTQRICYLAADSVRGAGGGSGGELTGEVTPAVVDQIVEGEFLAPGSDRREENLKHVRNRVTNRGRLTDRLLKVYQRVLGGEAVPDDATDPVHYELKLSGVVKARRDGRLAVRNRIYGHVFCDPWVEEVRAVKSER
jgi:hypothetical protein